MLNKSELSIGIVGLGLIGGSLAKVLAPKGYKLVAIAHSDATREKAKELGIFEKVSQKLEDLNGCSIIIVATPINTINMIFQQLNAIISRPCIVTDAASIKGEITDFGLKTFTNEMITFLPGHPMAGTENKGIDSAFPELYEEARWVICPLDPQKRTQINLLTEVIQDTGAKIVYANPYMHDLAAALISHMPLLVSMGLVEAIESQEDMVLQELSYFLAASGYRDTTRVAGGNPELSYDMLKYNEANVMKALDMFEEGIKTLKAKLQGPKEEAFEKFEEIAQVRKNLYDQNGKNIYRGLSGQL